jgi:hypothetical protein
MDKPNNENHDYLQFKGDKEIKSIIRDGIFY